MTKEEIADELKKANVEGYKKALKDLAENEYLDIRSYRAELDWEAETKSSKSEWSEWWDKNSSALIAVIGVLVVAFLGFCTNSKQIEQKDTELNQKTTELQQKDKEIQTTNAKTLGELIEKLSSENPLIRRYATFAAVGLDIKDFDKYVISSLKSPEDAETLEILLDRKKEQIESFEKNIKNPETDDNLKKQKDELQNLKKQLAELYARLSEAKRIEASKNAVAQTGLLEQSKQFANKALINDEKNVRATYQLAAINRDINIAEAIKGFEKVVELLKDDPGRASNEFFQKANLNLTWLYKKLSDDEALKSERDKNLNKARCYSAQTIDIYNTAGQDNYLFGKENGKLKEENFVNASTIVNPDKKTVHENCLDIK